MDLKVVGAAPRGRPLSPATETHDRGEKFKLYKRLPSLEDYVLVSRQRKEVEVFHKIPNQLNSWMLTTYEEGYAVKLSSVDMECNLDNLYRNITF